MAMQLELKHHAASLLEHKSLVMMSSPSTLESSLPATTPLPLDREHWRQPQSLEYSPQQSPISF